MQLKREKISIVTMVYNEENNVFPLYKELRAMLAERLPEFDYEIIFSDNHSTDSTQQKIEQLCAYDKNVKAIFNVRNFGATNSGFNGLRSASGDCAVIICADFQVPLDIIPVFVEKWKQGNKIVCGVKQSDRKESESMNLFRRLYYKVMRFLSDKEFVENFSGFGLFDRSVLESFREHNVTDMNVNYVVNIGYKYAKVYYKQEKRVSGKSGNKLSDLYSIVMTTLVDISKKAVRISEVLGVFLFLATFVSALAYLIVKLCVGGEFPMYKFAVLSAIGLFGSAQMMFLGLLGEYVLNIKAKITKGKLVVEERRINF